jgi:ribonuclease J
LVAANGEAVRGRGRIAYNGTAMVTVVVNEDGRLVGSAQLSHLGLLDDPDDELESAVLKAIETAIHKMTAQSRRDDNAVREIARLAARRSFRESLGKKPQTQVHLVRIAKEN